MFSIACAIGTGPVICSGGDLSKGGPGSLLIGYLLIGAAVFFVMTALGEMAGFVPMSTGFGGKATRMVDPALGFATGPNHDRSGVLPDIVNASLLVFTLSAAARVCLRRHLSLLPSLYGLARDRQAPSIFAKTRENGNPIFAVVATSIFLVLAYMNASKSSTKVFEYLVSLVTGFAVLNWVAILISYIRFRRAINAQCVSLKDVPYVGILQPWERTGTSI